jgi:uncharacterized protein YbaR (Trm112 family)
MGKLWIGTNRNNRGVYMRQSEINTFYGHEIYAHLTGKEFCDCEECTEIRPKIYAMLWRKTKKKNPKDETKDCPRCDKQTTKGYQDGARYCRNCRRYFPIINGKLIDPD